MTEVKLYVGNALERLKELKDCSVESIVTDPPYEIGYMGRGWDSTGIAYSVELWEEALRVLKPGGHILVFGATRTYHRVAVAIEDAGFEIRDSISWLYNSGMPKNQDISKAIDKKNGVSDKREVIGKRRAEDTNAFKGITVDNAKRVVVEIPITTAYSEEAKQWEGWGTALKPHHEAIVLARKPLAEKTIASNVLAHSTGAINIAATRYDKETVPEGRFPSNVMLDEHAAKELDLQKKDYSKFFYVAKPLKEERPIIDNVAHPTVKPLALMKQLIKLVTPPGGTVLDMFSGSGTTLEAAALEGFNAIGVELTEDYLPLIEARAKRSGFELTTFKK